MNNKGQSLVLFVLLIPVLIMIFALIFDSSLIILENNKLKNLAKTSITYMMKDNKTIEEVKEYIKKNDDTIEIIAITNSSIYLKKQKEGYFGKVIGYENYEFEIKYKGIYKKNKLTIE